MFMTVPKIIDRQPVFVSRETRDRIGSVVRRLGDKAEQLPIEKAARMKCHRTPFNRKYS
jgi:hypothetical protein